MRAFTLATVALAVLAGGALHAQTPSPDAPPAAAQETAPAAGSDAAPTAATGRYIFSRVDGGILRLDSVSGQVSLCAERGAGWACEAVPEERAAFDREVTRLKAEVDGLKAEVAALRVPAVPPRPPAELAPRGGDAKTGGLKLPTDDDIKWARAAIEKVWRQFVDMVADFQKDVQRKG